MATEPRPVVKEREAAGVERKAREREGAERRERKGVLYLAE